MAIPKGEPIEESAEPGFRESLKALRTLPKFFRLIWQTHKGMTAGNVALRLAESTMPLLQLYVGKLIIDAIITQAAADPALRDTQMLWTYVGMEFALVFVSALLNRGIALLDALLGDLFANETCAHL